MACAGKAVTLPYLIPPSPDLSERARRPDRRHPSQGLQARTYVHARTPTSSPHLAPRSAIGFYPSPLHALLAKSAAAGCDAFEETAQPPPRPRARSLARRPATGSPVIQICYVCTTSLRSSRRCVANAIRIGTRAHNHMWEWASGGRPVARDLRCQEENAKDSKMLRCRWIIQQQQQQQPLVACKRDIAHTLLYTSSGWPPGHGSISTYSCGRDGISQLRTRTTASQLLRTARDAQPVADVRLPSCLEINLTAAIFHSMPLLRALGGREGGLPQPAPAYVLSFAVSLMRAIPAQGPTTASALDAVILSWVLTVAEEGVPGGTSKISTLAVR